MSILQEEVATSRVLICDHRGEGVLDLARGLRAPGARIEFSQSLRESLERLARQRPDLLLVDPLSAGGFHELEVLDRARAKPGLVPMLLVCETEDQPAWRRAGQGMQAPAWDLVPRTASSEELRVRVARLLGETRLHRELRDLRHRASHDDRTDLLRPRAFQARLEEHFSAAQRHGLPMTLAMVDLDRFGAVNKEFDHTVGDEVIERVGEAVRRSLRAEDVAGRVGGDEFAVLLPFTSPEDAAGVVERLRLEIDRVSGLTLADKPLPLKVSGSIGYAHYDGVNLSDVETLRKRAEDALRRAKVAGGNRAIPYETSRPD
ncbi:MAG: diguanylate cyclase [Planctomycetota bacterium]